jgi:serine/threonine-protein kinase RsbW/stage II sporulation protein AB (anti-sigma F factor)
MSTTQPSSRTWSVPAVPGEVALLRQAVARYADTQRVADPPMSDVRLAVSEAMTNAVVHAYPTGPPGTVTVVVTVDADQALLTVVVTDDGAGLRPRSDSPGLGLGLPLITTLTRATTITDGPGGTGTRVSMTFGLA